MSDWRITNRWSRIDLAIGKTSTTAKNLRRTGKITFLITDSGMNYYVKGEAREVRESMDAVPFMSLFSVGVEQLSEDQEPDALYDGLFGGIGK